MALYGWLELGVAVTAAISLAGLAGVRAVYVAAYPHAAGNAGASVAPAIRGRGNRFVSAHVSDGRHACPFWCAGSRGTRPNLARVFLASTGSTRPAPWPEHSPPDFCFCRRSRAAAYAGNRRGVESRRGSAGAMLSRAKRRLLQSPNKAARWRPKLLMTRENTSPLPPATSRFLLAVFRHRGRHGHVLRNRLDAPALDATGQFHLRVHTDAGHVSHGNRAGQRAI